MSERPKELASKASVVQATVGSNPTVTATVALLEPPVPAPGVSTLPGRSPERHPSASSQVRWFSRRPPAFPSSAGLPGGNASFTVVRLSSRRPLVFPTGTLALRTNACATAQAYDRKASEPWERKRDSGVEPEPGRGLCGGKLRLEVVPHQRCGPAGLEVRPEQSVGDGIPRRTARHRPRPSIMRLLDETVVEQDPAHRDVVVACLCLDSRDPWIGVEQMANEFADRFPPPTPSAHPVGETDVEQWCIAVEIIEPHDPDETAPDPHGEKRVLRRGETPVRFS